MTYLEIDCSTEEVKKLKPQIQAKIGQLFKLDAKEIDDNLILYSLLLFENRHTRQSIIEGLKSFFPQNTSEPFVEWLWNILEPISESQKLSPLSSKKRNGENLPDDGIESSSTKAQETPNKMSQHISDSKHNSESSAKIEIAKRKRRFASTASDVKPDSGIAQENSKKSMDASNERVPKIRKIVETKMEEANDGMASKLKDEDQPNITPDPIKGKMGDTNPITSLDSNIKIDKDALEKLKERAKSVVSCAFYPNCKNGQNCPYFHPQPKICSFYPNCARGASCHFLHVTKANKAQPEKCYYGERCINAHCKFSHPQAKRSKTPCRNGTECNRTDCIFAHPFKGNAGPKKLTGKTLCRFDQKCENKFCKYWHPLRDRNIGFLLKSQDEKSESKGSESAGKQGDENGQSLSQMLLGINANRKEKINAK